MGIYEVVVYETVEKVVKVNAVNVDDAEERVKKGEGVELNSYWPRREVISVESADE